MLPEVEKLLTLQERDQRIRAFQQELQAIPGEQTIKQKQISDSTARLEAAKTRMKEIEVERKSLEVDAEAKRNSIARYKEQQFQTRKNEEYAALGHEITAAEKAIVAIEDRELDLMEEAEKLKPAVAEAEREHTEERAKLQAQIEELSRKSDNIKTRVKELEDTRTALTDGVDEDLLDVYARLFKSKHGVALAELEHGVCSGCHVKVTTQTALAVEADRTLVNCPNCGRILHLPA